MLRKDVQIEPTEKRMAAFNASKAMLTTPPVLAMPNDEGKWVVMSIALRSPWAQ